MFTVLITGATGGIGASLAREYASDNTCLILLARNEQALSLLAEQCERRGAMVETYCLDIASIEDSVSLSKEIVAHHQVDLFVSNAGITNSTTDKQPESWEIIELVIRTNLTAALAISHAIVEDMHQRQAGQVAYVSSLGAYYGMPLTPAYCASKAGLKAYAEAMRGLLASSAVEVSLIAPGFVKTALSDQFSGSKPFLLSPERAARLIKRGLDRKRKVIAFPFPLALGMRVLSCLPASLADFILSRLKY